MKNNLLNPEVDVTVLSVKDVCGVVGLSLKVASDKVNVDSGFKAVSFTKVIRARELNVSKGLVP